MSKRVFISHSAEDKEFALAVVELLEDMGLGENDIFCSSVAGYGIPLGIGKVKIQIYCKIKNLLSLKLSNHTHCVISQILERNM